MLNLCLQAVSNDWSRLLSLEEGIESWLEKSHLLSLALVEGLAHIAMEEYLLPLFLISIISKVMTEV